MRPAPYASLRVWSRRVLAPTMIGLVVGCSPLDSGSGCEPPPPATDASSPTVSLDCRQTPPCYGSSEAVRGSDPHLTIGFQCPGTSKTFLAAIKVDGTLASMHEVQCAAYGTLVTIDAGHWEPPDTLWHTVEVILDPLNLFKESNESNNRGSALLRIVDPRARPATSRLESRGRR
jgi:hypothetical protein